jgi:hypothetical protein
MVRRRIAAIVALGVFVTGCGDVLQGVGDLSEAVVNNDRPTTTTTQPGVVDLRLAPITGAVWVNDELGATTAGLTPDDLLLAIWFRGDQTNEFVQASRREISEALPGVEFPQLSPQDITHVTSQLVFDVATASLGVGTAAAFGLWVGEPYTAPRSEAQLAVLRVGVKTFDDGSPDNEVLSFSVADGRELTWVDGDYVYQLFCRTGVSLDACEAMAESTVPLSLLVALPSFEG